MEHSFLLEQLDGKVYTQRRNYKNTIHDITKSTIRALGYWEIVEAEEEQRYQLVSHDQGWEGAS